MKGKSNDASPSRAPAFWRLIPGLRPAQRYPLGAEMFQQGSAAQHVYVIGEGLVKLIHLEPNGRELIIDVRFPGSFLGAAAASAQQPHSETATAVTTCWLHCMSKDTFRQMVEAGGPMSWHLHQMLSRELCEQAVRLAQLGCLSSRHRLDHILWHLVSKQDDDMQCKEIRLRLPLKRWEIAELIAVTPEHLSRLVKEMEEEGVLRQEKGWLIVADLQKLGELAGAHAAAASR